MGSETRRHQSHCDKVGQPMTGFESCCRPTPTPAADGEREDVPITVRNALRDPNYTPYCGDGRTCSMPRARKTGHLTYKCPECGFEMDLRPALERLLALRARPALPDDVRAAAERVRRNLCGDHSDFECTFGDHVVETRDLRTLLSHLQRTEG